MILANYARQNRNCVRELGAAFSNPLGQFRPPLFMGFYVPDAEQQSGRDLSAFPHGYNTEAAWQLPLRAGGLSARPAGSGDFAALGALVRLAVAALTGSGDITEADVQKLVALAAALSGSGGISSAGVQAFLQAVAALTGAGAVSAAPLTGRGALLAAVAGSGTAATSIATGRGALSADLVVTGAGLTTANVGDAVWSALAAANNGAGTMGEKLNDAGSASNPWTEVIEAGYTAAEILRILAAHAAGAATGLEGANPQFTGLDGTTVRIDGTYSSGTRTIDSLDGS
ncbi:MAG: hypothetical protein EKK62_04005 [Acidimicrobiia bacterium]|nr:MAG: hypothetical protein EKK62_04005 [Acidimicrobiia bacterium]